MPSPPADSPRKKALSQRELATLKAYLETCRPVTVIGSVSWIERAREAVERRRAPQTPQPDANTSEPSDDVR